MDAMRKLVRQMLEGQFAVVSCTQELSIEKVYSITNSVEKARGIVRANILLDPKVDIMRKHEGRLRLMGWLKA